MSIKYNKKQLKVINDENHETLVSAGAGSGKTGTLVGKTTHLLKKGVDLDNFLILTFTNKAAFDMKEKIRKALLKDESLKDNALKVDSANIETFDSFALNFVKQHASFLNKESNLEILDDTILNFTKIEIMERIITKLILNDSDETKIFLNAFSSKTSFNLLVDSLIKTYTALKKEYELLNLDYKIILYEYLNLDFDKYLHNLDDDFYNQNEELLLKLNTFFINLKEGKPLLSDKLPNRKSPKLLTKEEDKLFKLYTEIYNSCQTDDINFFKEYLKTFSKIILDVLREFDLELDKFKESSNKYEFDDIADFLIKILKNNKDILNRLKNKYHYIFIDEYQDTSKIQSDFLDLLIKNNHQVKALYVGDIKQSIYKFRDAKPDYFINKEKNANVITLNKNYRSSPKILKFVNQIFTNIFTDIKKHDFIYKNNHEMESGNTSYENDFFSGVYLEKLFYDKSYNSKNKREEEAFTIGLKIKELLNQKIIKDYKEVTILVRNAKYIHIFKDVFDYLKIPLQIQRERSVNKDYFLKLLSSALMLAKSMLKDIDLNDKDFRFNYLSVGRSELFNLSDYELFKTLTSNDLKLYNQEILQKAKELSHYLKDYPNLVIVDKLIEIFDVNNKIITTNHYDLKKIELDYLYSLATALNDLDLNGIDFVNYLYDFTFLNEHNSSVKVLHESDENSVRITNFHQSKGLEYDVLFVAGLYNNLFRAQNIGKIEFNKDLGLTFKTKFYEELDLDNLKGLYNFYRYNIEKIIKEENLKEELRLLYVAFTRAKRALFINVFEEDFKENQNFIQILNNAGLENYVNHIKIYEKSNLKDYDEIKNKVLKYPKIIDEIKENKTEYKYEFKEVKKASKDLMDIIDDSLKKSLIKGTMSHEKFEFVDFSKLNESNDKDLINFHQTKFGNKYIKDANEFIKEFEFYDDELGINGIIDLLVFYDDEIHIIDYKQSNIDDPAYEDQLKGYLHYLTKIYKNIKIKAYLYSINKVFSKEVFIS
ncbi:MAG: UvrD-helicase domain-containing protein [Acholeplasmataceae bacterium]